MDAAKLAAAWSLLMCAVAELGMPAAQAEAEGADRRRAPFAAVAPAGETDARVRVVCEGSEAEAIVRDTAMRVLRKTEGWAGHRIEWGREGCLVIAVGTETMHAETSRASYNLDEGTVRVGSVAVTEAAGHEGHVLVEAWRAPDIVAHEAGHAVLHALKPGWKEGMSIVLHEGLADAMAFLVSLDEPGAVERILGETGGDLRRANEASRLGECLFTTELGRTPAGIAFVRPRAS